MAWTESDNYTATHPTAKGTLADKRLGICVPVVIPLYGVVPSSPGASPDVKMAKVPAGFKPLHVQLHWEALSASAGVALTATLGDSGSAARLLGTTDMDAAGSSAGLVVAGANYEYTAETDIVLAVITGKTPVVGAKLWGYILGVVRQ